MRRRTIAIVVMPERGGYYATFALAKGLREHGWRVVYYGPKDFAEDVRAQGLEYVTMFEQEYGPGTVDTDPLPESFFGYVRRLKQQASRLGVRRLREALVSGEMAAVLHQENVEVVLLDALLPELAPALVYDGFKVISLATELIAADFRHPPSVCSCVPRHGSLRSAAWCRLLWVAHFVRFHACDWFWKALSVLYIGDRLPQELRRQLASIRKASGLQGRFSEYGWRYRLPEVILCSEAFDFPTGTARTRLYAGATIDLQRAAVAFPWSRLTGAQRGVVYVSLGTHAAMYRRMTYPFLLKVLAVARRRADLVFVLSLGKGRSENDFGALPPNVIGVPFAPQLEVLQRASVMITNGGLGTVKECIWFRVPMIVVPCAFDQPGNAARVVFHRLGVRADVKRVTVDELSALIDACLRRDDIRSALEQMSTALRDRREFEAVLNILTSL